MTSAMSHPPSKISDTMKKPLPKRFYKRASHAARDGAFAIELDGRPAKTPLKRQLATSCEPLAATMAAEWEAQVSEIDPGRMPVTRIVITAIDAVTGKEADVAADMAAYAGSDFLCYRADGPEALVTRQCAAWDPILAWARAELSADFKTTSGLMHVAQPPAATTKIAEALHGQSALRLAALHVLTTLTGSAILALAIARRHVTLDTAWAAAHVDEDWQIEKWGADAEAEARRAGRLIDARAAALILDLT
jgi:chaperone required for assembly of F1-ATPase